MTDPVFEVRSRITHRSLMNKTKHEIASQVLELLGQGDRLEHTVPLSVDDKWVHVGASGDKELDWDLKIPRFDAAMELAGPFEEAYWKASETSDPEWWMRAALLGKQLVNALKEPEKSNA